MRAPRGAFAATAAALAILTVPAAASADERVVAGPAPNAYLQTEVTIDRGEAVTFLNADASVAHNVTSDKFVRLKRKRKRKRPPPRPLFASATVGPFEETPVTGAESLRPGSYGFFCSLHSFMKGTLHVR